MKVCTKCGIAKQESDYFIREQKSGRLHAQCKLCYKAHRGTYSAEHYARYGDLYRKRARIRRAKIKNGLRSKMIEYLADKSCQICGENDICVLDFDHLDPENKKFGVSNAITKCLGWDIILAEISKCRILCANCHRRHTAVQQGWYRSIIKK